MEKGAQFMRWWMWTQLYIIVKSPDLMEKIFHSPICIEKDETYERIFSDWIGGVFTAKPPKWGVMRKLLNPVFSRKYLDSVNFESIVNEEAATLVKCLEDDLDHHFDPYKYIFHFNLEISLRSHFGYKANMQTERDYRFYNLSRKLITEILIRVMQPLYHYDIIYKKTRAFKEIKRLHEICREFLIPIIQDVRNYNKEQVVKGEPVKAEFIHNIEKYLSKSKNDVTDKDILLETADLLVAGSDTSSGILCQTLLHIAADETIQERIREEAKQAIEGREFLTQAAANEMKYMEMVIKEALRIYTVPGVLRKASEDFRIDSRNVIPKGSTIYIHMHSLHHDPDHWERPHEFYPEHFTPEAEAARHKYAYIPFIAGSRNCPGKQYSRYVAKACLAHLITKYKLTTNQIIDFSRQNYAFVLEPMDGFSIKFSRL